MTKSTEETSESMQEIIPVSIEDETRTSYLNYAVYVLTHRAIPKIEDGLKPVLRRLFVAMHQMGLTHDKPHKKTVRIVGETMGKYHPYGDSSIYHTLVRLVQKWSMRYPLVDGQGNFGSMDGDEPAAMRYTEGRLKRIAEDGLLTDLSKEVVTFQPNFDSSLEEPTLLPARLPNLLVNGSIGIAVGMATSMAPHNLREVTDGICAYIDNPDLTLEELMKHIKAPDFPTGGIIYGMEGVRKAFETGKGKIVVRGKARIDILPNKREQIVATEVPYMVNKAQMILKTANLINNKTLSGIADLRDESDQEGTRVVYELKKDAIANVVLNNLYKYTALQSAFNVNNIVLIDGTPTLVNLKTLIVHYVKHRHEIVTKRTQAEQKKAQRQKHLLEGYLLVADHVDAMIKLIKQSKDTPEAKQALRDKYELSEIQAKAILEMRFQRLTSLEQEKILQQYNDLEKQLVYLQEVLANKGKRMQIIKKELQDICKRYGDDRRTMLEHDPTAIKMEDLIPNERMVITLSQQGYIKSTPLVKYRLQNRGGVGAKGGHSKQGDVLSQLFVASSHDYLLIFTAFGKVYWKKVYTLPQGGKNAQGRAIQNVLNIEPGDTVCSILRIEKLRDPQFVKNRFVTLCTQQGIIKKTSLEAFTRPQRKGIRAIIFKEKDLLVEAKLTEEDHYIVIALASGKAIRFNQTELRPMGRAARGVQGITLAHAEDKVIGIISAKEEVDTTLLVLSEKGYGKRSAMKDYRITRRRGKGIKTMQISPKTGKLIAMKAVKKHDELMIMNASGITIRTAIKSLRTMRRATQGVRMLRLKKDDCIASVAVISQIQEK